MDPQQIHYNCLQQFLTEIESKFCRVMACNPSKEDLKDGLTEQYSPKRPKAEMFNHHKTIYVEFNFTYGQNL